MKLVGFLTFGMFAIAFSPVLAEDFVIGEISPLEAVTNVPIELSVSVSSPSGVASCDMYISSKNKGAMDYDDADGLWKFTWTFDETRTADSVRAKCVNGEGDELMGPSKVLNVTDIDLTSEHGLGENGPTYIGEVDATELSFDEIVDRSPVLIKTQCPGGEDVNDPCRTVYFLDAVGDRHAFPNEKVFFSWYESFDGVHVVTDGMMADFKLNGNVVYKPGQLMKFPSVNTVYYVGLAGDLFVVESEADAIGYFGEDWSSQVHDVAETFFSNYTIKVYQTVGATIESVNEMYNKGCEYNINNLYFAVGC